MLLWLLGASWKRGWFSRPLSDRHFHSLLCRIDSVSLPSVHISHASFRRRTAFLAVVVASLLYAAPTSFSHVRLAFAPTVK